MGAGDVEVNVDSANAKAGAFFDGTDDRVDVGAAGALDIDPLISISAWVKVDNIVGVKTIISNRPNGTDYWDFLITTAAIRWTGEIGNVGDSTTSGAVMVAREWTHVTVTYNDTTKTTNIYKNGVNIVLNDTLSDPVLAAHGGQGMIGTIEQNPLAENFKGEISEVKVWNRILTPAEVLQDYNGIQITDGRIHRWELKSDYTDEKGTADGTNAGSRLGIYDDTIAAAVAADRTTSDDIYMIAMSANNQAITTIIDET